ncbi:hypothetical protein [Stenotrophomonas sp.]|uniref:hypothetical protein n=1 Tax=Stenotrophomonas sp. TaxID=69392 RepID=UPI002FCBCCA6
MSWGLAWLGLADDAATDVRAVRRAYAHRLRVTRPDEDAVAFQYLHEAYQDALAWVQARDEDRTGPVGVAVAVAAPGSAAAPPPILDAAAVAARIAAFATAHDAPALQAWLQQQPELWSLRDKPAISVAVLRALQSGDPPLSPPVVACLTACFAWDDLRGDIDPMHLERVAHRWHQAWLLSAQGEAALGERYLDLTDALLLHPHRVLRRLREPRPGWRNLLTTLLPTRANEVIGVLRALDFWRDRRTPPGLDPGQVVFWSRFCNPDDRIHLLSGALRAGTLATFVGLLCLWGVAGSWPLPPTGDGQSSGARRALLIVLIGTLLVPALWVFGEGVSRLLRWQRAPEHHASALPGLRILAIPLLVASAMGSLWLSLRLTPGIPVNTLLGLAAANALILLVAWQRLHARCGAASAGASGGLWLALALLTIVPAWGVALVWWAQDLHHHRDRLRWSNRRAHDPGK